MKSFIVFITLTLSIVVVNPSYAQAQEWTPWTSVELIYPFSSGNVLLRLEGSHEDGSNPPQPIVRGCSGTFYYLLRQSNKSFDLITAQLMASQYNGDAVEIRAYLDGCSSSGTTGWPIVDRIQVR